MRAALGAALLGLVLTACSDAQPPPAAAPSTPPAGPGVHLALGDSVAAGVGAPPDLGYVPLVTERLRAACACEVELRNLAVAGATTASLLRGQLPQAQDALRRGDVRVVTVTIGGNDVFGPVLLGCARAPQSAGCQEAVGTALRQADDGLRQVLDGLREAAGPSTPIAVMTYYDPVPSCELSPLAGLSAVVLEGTDDRPGLNDVVRERARDAGAVVVETAGLLEGADLVGGRDCLHPSPRGHVRIADAFADALR